MGRGSSKSGGRAAGGGGVNVTETRDMISARDATNQAQVDEVLSVAKVMNQKYGDDVAIEGSYQLAKIKSNGGGRVLGYYDSDGNIAMNEEVMNNMNLNASYDAGTASGYHPSRGKHSAVYAVAAHETGHSLTENVRKKMGAKTYEEAATRIVDEARKTTKHRGNIKFARSISEYATVSNAETIAEAVSDVFCNGKRAKKESHAVVNVIDNYLLGDKKSKKKK